MKKFINFFFTSLLILVTQFSSANPDPVTYKHKFLAFGTYVEIVINGVDEKTAQSAFREIEEDYLYFHRTWDPWGQGALRRINTLFPGTVWFSMAPSMSDIMQRAQGYAEKSDHLFNPAIGKLIQLWGFHKMDKPPTAPPQASDILALVKSNPRMSDVETQGIRIRSKNADVMIDLGGVAKGHAVDLGIETLKRRGIKNAIINAGGDLKCIGQQGTRPWRIAIRKPIEQMAQLGSVEVSGEEAVVTSGDYERFYIHEGKRFHHIIDPRSGYPTTDTRSVTVLHKDTALADAAATALMVAGPKEWVRIAKRMGIIHVALLATDGQLYLSSAMRKRITLHETPKNIVVVNLETP